MKEENRKRAYACIPEQARKDGTKIYRPFKKKPFFASPSKVQYGTVQYSIDKNKLSLEKLVECNARPCLDPSSFLSLMIQICLFPPPPPPPLPAAAEPAKHGKGGRKEKEEGWEEALQSTALCCGITRNCRKEGRKEAAGKMLSRRRRRWEKRGGRFGIRTMEISSHSSFSPSSSHTEEREKERRRRLDPVLSPSSPFLCHGKEEERRRRRSRKGDPKSEKSRDSTFSPLPRPPFPFRRLLGQNARFLGQGFFKGGKKKVFGKPTKKHCRYKNEVV